MNGFDEKNADLITLDMLNPERVPFSKSLKLGGYTVAYLPHLAQVKAFCSALADGLIVERILDVREDEYFSDGGLNRKNKIRHTAYLVFVRKVLDQKQRLRLSKSIIDPNNPTS